MNIKDTVCVCVCVCLSTTGCLAGCCCERVGLKEAERERAATILGVYVVIHERAPKRSMTTVSTICYSTSPTRVASIVSLYLFECADVLMFVVFCIFFNIIS